MEEHTITGVMVPIYLYLPKVKMVQIRLRFFRMEIKSILLPGINQRKLQETNFDDPIISVITEGGLCVR